MALKYEKEDGRKVKGNNGGGGEGLKNPFQEHYALNPDYEGE